MRLLFIFTVVFIFCGRRSYCQEDYIPVAGDIIFQDLDCGEFCDAIEKVTSGIDGKDFSHVGIVEVKNNKAFVIEAIGRGVVKTPLDSFLFRSLTKEGRPKVIVGRLKTEFSSCIPGALEKADSLNGKKYDAVFDIHNDRYYCSELLYYSFLDNSGKSLFELQPMTFDDPETRTPFPAWKTYFDELGMDIPEGKPGLNPGGISRSSCIEIVYSYF
jgi:hypothetical protein